MATPTIQFSKKTGDVSAGPKMAWIWVWSFVMWLLCLRLPQQAAADGPDDSWRQVLWYAHTQGLQFGNDIVFTYGPLGFLANFKVTEEPVWIRAVFAIVLCLFVTTAMSLLAARMRPGWRFLFLGLFALLSAPIEEGRDDLFFNVGFLCWGLLCWLETAPRLKWAVICLTAMATVGAMIKFTLLVTGTLSVATVAGMLVLRERKTWSIAMLVCFAGGIAGEWVLLGQKLPVLREFGVYSMLVAGGYNSAMNIMPLGSHGGMICMAGLAGLTALTLVLRAVKADVQNDWQKGVQRLLLGGWLAALVFVHWKHGITRGDVFHVPAFTLFTLTTALAMETVSGLYGKGLRLARFMSVLCVVLALVIARQYFEGHAKGIAEKFAEGISDNLHAAMNPKNIGVEGRKKFEEAETQARLKVLDPLIGGKTVDVFGHHQTSALMNHLNYHPRPVFQSYSVYSQPLNGLNEEFYCSSEAPDFVLFKLDPIDDRFPPLEDAFVLGHLLMNYQFVKSEEPFLLLRRKTSASPKLTLLHEGDVALGQPIATTKFGKTNLWLEIYLYPTSLGKLNQFLYKPSPVELEVQNQLGAKTSYLAPVPMLAAGFVASPLLTTNSDVAAFYAGGDVGRPKAYSLSIAPETAKFWQEQAHYRIYEIDRKQGQSAR